MLILLDFTWSDAAWAALAVFLLVVGFGLLYVCIRLGATLAGLTSLIRGSEREVLPVINKTGGTLDRVNLQLDKVDRMSDSAVDAVDHADTAVRAVSRAITRPVQKVSGLAAGLSYGFASLRATRDWRTAVQTGREASARRELDLAEELRAAGRRPME
jgi:hypothetical protein